MLRNGLVSNRQETFLHCRSRENRQEPKEVRGKSMLNFAGECNGVNRTKIKAM